MRDTPIKLSVAVTALLTSAVSGCSNVEEDPVLGDPPAPIQVAAEENSHPAEVKDASANLDETKPGPGLADTIASNGLQPGLDSTGDGPPSGQVALSISKPSVAGEWLVTWANDESKGQLRLVASGGTAAGDVELSSDWSAPVRPTRWIYLALGQLTLTDDTGQIVWAGRVEDDQRIVQMRDDVLAIESLSRP